MSGRGDGKLRPAYIRRGERYWKHQDQKKTSIDEKIEYLRWKGMTDDEIQRVQANVQARYPDTVLENTPLPETGRRKKRSKSGLQRKATNKNPRTRTVLVQQQTEDAAATKIQSIQRGRRSRNDVRMRKKEREEAATKIQAIQRGKIQRKTNQQNQTPPRVAGMRVCTSYITCTLHMHTSSQLSWCNLPLLSRLCRS